MRLGILGGTFDPVHLGHLVLATMAGEQLSLDWVLFVPAGQPWRKPGRPVASGEHRLQMLQLATVHNSGFDVVSVEVERPGPSYTVDTLKWFREQQATAELFFIVGQDALADLPSWHQPGQILKLASLAVARRPGAEGSLEEAGTSLPMLEGRVEWVAMPQIEISATMIRERVKDHLPIRYLVPDTVEAYIREHELYR